MSSEFQRGFDYAVMRFIKSIDEAIYSYNSNIEFEKQFPKQWDGALECLRTFKQFIVAYYIEKVNAAINAELLIEKEKNDL